MATTQRRLPLEQLLALPEAKPALEFYDGVIRQKMPPQIRHARLQPKLAEAVNRFAEPRELAMAFTEMRAIFDRLALVPDVSIC